MKIPIKIYILKNIDRATLFYNTASLNNEINNE